MKGALIAVSLAAAASVSGVLVAEVRLIQRPDGTHYMYNVGGAPSRSALSRPGPVRPAVSQEIDIEDIIARHSRRQRLDPDLVKAVIAAESAFDRRAVSRQGAMGLMQLMPATATTLAVDDPFDVEQNIGGGTRYLRQMLDAFEGSLDLALAAYNAGPEAVRRFNGIPPYTETIGYVEKVMRAYNNDPGYAVRSSARVGRGRQTYLTRDRDGRLVLSTTPPSAN